MLALYFMHSASYAGIFGPSNFDECMAENIKGMEEGILYARRACQRKFEAQIPLHERNLKKGDIIWEYVDENTIKLKINNNPSPDYIITKIKYAFTAVDCKDRHLFPEDFEIVEVFEFNQNSYFGEKTRSIRTSIMHIILAAADQ